MGDLKNRAVRREDTSLIGRMLPLEIREQLIHAKRTRSHSVQEMIDWLHDPEEGHPPEYREITKSVLDGWFSRNGITGPAKNGGRLPNQAQNYG